MYAPQATQAIVENNTDLFVRIDRQGWSQIYDNGFQPDSGSVFTLGDSGELLPYERTQATKYTLTDDGRLVPLDAPIPLMLDDWLPAPESSQAESPHGLPNVLGVGIFG